MYSLYIANKNYSSWSLRPWILMRELAIPFQEKIVPFGSDNNWDAFRSFSPAGKVPCLHDGAAVVWDSIGITEFLAERHAGVWPQDSAARSWARCAAAEMHSGFSTLRQQCPMHCALRIRMTDISPAFQRDVDRLKELWNEGLTRFGGPFLAGEKFTAVDAFFAPVVLRVQSYGIVLDAVSAAYAQRLLGLASMQEWQAAALKETWREPAHEADALAAGTLVQDLRNA